MQNRDPLRALMPASTSKITLPVTKGHSAKREVLLGFAPAKILHALSFADVLDEDTGRGYQRRFNAQHSLDFRRYVLQQPDSTTIPLTFNLRPEKSAAWKIAQTKNQTRLEISGLEKVLAQVDCQHRLGHLSDSDLELPFMCFVGLSAREEMEIFNTINSKAKGLNISLIDFHNAQLTDDVALDRPELFIAIAMRNEPSSPWYKQLDLGGKSSSGLTRRASLRTFQKAVQRFLKATAVLKTTPPAAVARIVLEFWQAVAITLSEPWGNPRKHQLTKGVGVYALMDIAADIYLESIKIHRPCDKAYFIGALADFAPDFDWSNAGPLRGLGGEVGAKAAAAAIRAARRSSRLKLVSNA